MKTASISVLVQNNEPYLNWLLPTLDLLAQSTNTEFIFNFIENGSVDKTSQLINRYLTGRNGELSTYGNTKYLESLDRISRITMLRQLMLKKINGLNTQADYILDTNVYFTSDVFHKLANFKSDCNSSIGLVCAYGEEVSRLKSGEIVTEGHYYDTLAFRTVDNKRYWPHCVFTSCRRCIEHVKADRIEPEGLVRVSAAFGGLAVLDHRIVNDTTLDWGATGWLDARTEHDLFCDLITKANREIAINCDAKVYWSKDSI